MPIMTTGLRQGTRCVCLVMGVSLTVAATGAGKVAAFPPAVSAAGSGPTSGSVSGDPVETPQGGAPAGIRFADGRLWIRAQGAPLERVLHGVMRESRHPLNFAALPAGLTVTATLEDVDLETALRALLSAVSVTDLRWVYEPSPQGHRIGTWRLVGNSVPEAEPLPARGHGWAERLRASLYDLHARRFIEVAAGEVLVRLRPGRPIDAVVQRLEAGGMTVTRTSGPLGYLRIRVPHPRPLTLALHELRADADVDVAEPNPILAAAAMRSGDVDPRRAEQWGLDRIHAAQAWATTTGSPDVVIAVVDTGVDAQHPDLAGAVLPGYSVLTQEATTQDDHGHGTALAGVVAARLDNGEGGAGVCPDCRVLPITALDSDGIGTMADVAAGAMYAVDHGARVILLGLGGRGYSQVLADALEQTYARGVVVVAAAGNGGAEEVLFPASYPTVMAVGATHADDVALPSSNRGDALRVVAPGAYILTTEVTGGYGRYSGTSLAAAFVAGAAGLVEAGHPTLGRALVEQTLATTTADLGPLGRDLTYGFGLLDVGAAVAQPAAPTHGIAVTGIEISPASLRVGEAATVHVTVQNTGTVDERALLLRIMADGVAIGAAMVSYLAVGEIRTLTFYWTPSATVARVTLTAAVSGQTAEGTLLTAATSRQVWLATSGDIVTVQYGYNAHRWIVENAANILPLGPMRDEIYQYLGANTTYQVCDAGADTGSSIEEGALEEDDGPSLSHPICNNPKGEDREMRYLRHFWQPNLGYQAGFTKIGCSEGPCRSAPEEAEIQWQQAIAEYEAGRHASAYWYLGRVAHLLSDMASPAHLHDDSHAGDPLGGDDSYEAWTESPANFPAGLGQTPVVPWLMDLSVVGNWTDAPHQVAADGTTQPGQDYSQLSPGQSGLFKLFLRLAEIGDDYASDDVAGEYEPDPVGDLSEAQRATHAKALVPEAIQHVAGLFQLFWSATHPVPFISARPSGALWSRTGVPFTIELTADNVGTTASWGGLSVSFPELTAKSAGSDCGNPSKYESSEIAVSVQSSEFEQVRFYRRGCALSGHDGPIVAEHLLVEATVDTFDQIPRTLRLTVIPKTAMRLQVRARMALCRDSTCDGEEPGRDPFAVPEAFDQQGYPSYVFAASIDASGTPMFAEITTIAGRGTEQGDGVPATSAYLYPARNLTLTPSGTLYFAGSAVHRIDLSSGVLHYIAGGGVIGPPNDGGPASAAHLYAEGVAVDRAGNLYILDAMGDSDRIRKISATTGVITTVAGGGTLNPDGVPATSASFGELSAITIDQDDNLYVVAYNSARVYKVDAKNGVCRKVAGSSSGMSGDGGPATLAKLSYPEGVAVDREGNLYVADTWNCRVRKISADTGVITTVAGHGSLGLGCGYWGDGGPATLAMLHRPHDIAVDAAGNLYISDPGKSRVRMVAAGTGVITTIAGTGVFGDGGDGGPAAEAEMIGLGGLALDAVGNLYVGNYLTLGGGLIRKIRAVKPAAPSVVSHPESTVVTPGGLALFTADAAGGPDPHVQWQCSSDGGTTWADLNGATSPTCSFTATQADTGKQFRAVFANGEGTATSNPATLLVGPAPVTARLRGDFTGDLKSDMLWRHASLGEVWLWPMDGTTRLVESFVRTVADTNWEIRGLGDQTGDGKADLLWRNKVSGEVYFWPMDGSTPESELYVGTVATDYDIVGTGDFDADGKSDLLWRNLLNGEVWVWLMDGATPLSQTYVDTVDPAYVVKGVGDLDADGRADIVWHHATLGEVWVWPMIGATRLSQHWVGTVPDTGYQIVGVADHTGDGKADLLWWHNTRGEVWLWPMNGTTLVSQSYVGIVPDTGYRIVASGDYDGDGKADILWHHATRGEVWLWPMNGATRLAETKVATVPDTGYQIVKVK